MRNVVGSVLFGATLLVACNGATEIVSDCPPGSDCSSAPGSDAGTDGSTKSDGGTGGGGNACTTSTGGGIQACVPGVATAGAPTTIEVMVNDCLGCFTTVTGCDVAVKGSIVTLTTTTQTCPPPGDQACPAVCAVGKVTCTLPGLAAGTYDVLLLGENEIPPRTLVVEDGNGGPKGCTLPAPGTPIPPLTVGADEQKTCTADEDCLPSRTGDACQPCTCPNTAIMKTAEAAYEARKREAQALCAHDTPPPSCGACPEVTARCVAGTCQL